MDDVLASIIADALEQSEELSDLDAPRAELWASDLMALAAEADPDGLSQIIAALTAAGGRGPTAALWALEALASTDPHGSVIDLAAVDGPRPSWADHLGTSVCEAAWMVGNWRGSSVAFRFVDQGDDRHVMVVDLVPSASEGGSETIGEVTVGPISLLDAFDDPDAKLLAEPMAADQLASRVGAALAATEEPAPSLVAAGRLLLARLDGLGVGGLSAPVWVEPEVVEPPPADPDDQRWARSVLAQALGTAPANDADPAVLSGLADADPAVLSGLADAARILRESAAVDGPLAQWLAASRGPVDLDDDDRAVVVAALAATVQPATVLPLWPETRRAVGILEYADWLGLVIELVRSGPGASADPHALVDLINRCPEVTSTIPKADRDRVAWALAVCCELWEPLGLTDDHCLTGLGLALLPAMLDHAWSLAD